MRRASYIVLVVLGGALGFGCGKPLPPGEAEFGRGEFAAAAAKLEELKGPGLVALAADVDRWWRLRTLWAYSLAMSGKDAEADAQFELLQGEAAHQEPSLNTARVGVFQALVESERGELDAAAQHFETAEDELHRLGLDRSLENALCQSGWGVIESLRGDIPQSERRLARAVSILRPMRNEYPFQFAEAASNLGTILVSRQNPRAAMPHYQQALRSLRDAKIPVSEQLGHTLNGLAYTQYQIGEDDYAEKNLLEAIEVFRAVLGGESSETAKCYHDLAKVYQHAGEPAKAEAAFEKSIQIYRNTVGEDHPFTKQAVASYAEFLRDSGRDAEADALPGKSTVDTPAE